MKSKKKLIFLIYGMLEAHKMAFKLKFRIEPTFSIPGLQFIVYSCPYQAKIKKVFYIHFSSSPTPLRQVAKST
jgi:hypothetical protein